MADKEKHLTINERGVFSIQSRRMTAKGILNHRARLQTQILEARENLVYWQKEVTRREAELADYNKPIVDNYLQQMAEAKIVAEKKAQQMLREFVGDGAYKQIQKKGSIAFTAKDGLKYRVNSRGHVFRGGRRLCIIKPSDLPVPDFVIAALVNVRENPKRFPFRR